MGEPRLAVVTGAGGQIGRRLVAGLAARGYDVLALDLPAALPGGDDRFRPCDITDEDQVRAVVGQLPRIDLLVHSAGLSAIGGFAEHDLATHRRVMDVTHFGAVSVTQTALLALRAAGGRVVLIGSVAGFAPVLGRPPYVAAKHAVTGLFAAIRPELEAVGVGLTVVHPTFVTGGMSEATARHAAARVTTGETLTAEQVAVAVLDAAASGRPLALVGRTARRAWVVSRFAPRLYLRLMVRRLTASGTKGDPR